jgi:hypothetical protein
MILQYGIVLSTVILQLIGCTISKGIKVNVPKIHREVSFLGSTRVIIQREDYGPGKVFVHPHANEITALEAARLIARSQGGQVITLVHAKTRNIEFTYHGKKCEFDPNRIFTPIGIEKTLSSYGCDDKYSRAIVAGFAAQFLASIPKGKIIAVHNNQDYSMKNYFLNHPLAHDASAVYHQPGRFYRNFFLVTKSQDFNLLKSQDFNVVLQSPQVTDDGSMSVFFAKQHYINVEAGYGQLFQQMHMLEKA